MITGTAASTETPQNEWLDIDIDIDIDSDEVDCSAGELEQVIATVEPIHSRSRRTSKKASKSVEEYSERDRIVMAHLPLVKAIAVRVHETLPVHVEVDDLTHAGILGLFDAASKFDPEKQVSFAGYAKHRIKGAILDSLRQLDWASRELRRRHRQVDNATRELTAKLGRVPTEAEIADHLAIDVDRLRQLMLDLRNVGLVSADTRATDHDELPSPEFAGNENIQPDNMCSREQMREVLERAMSGLSPRYRQVVTLYYSNELTMKEIGQMLGINESRVSQIHKSALEKMNAALHTAGIHSSTAFLEL